MAEKQTRLQEAIQNLSGAVENANKVFLDMDKSDLAVMLTFYRHIHDAKEDIDEILKFVKSMHDNLSHDMLADLMEAQDIQSIRRDDRNFVFSVQVNASIPKDNPEPGFDWLRRVAKAPAIIVPHVNPKQLTGVVTGYFDAHGEWPPEEAVRVFKKRHVAVRRK